MDISYAESLFAILTLAGLSIVLNWLAHSRQFFRLPPYKKRPTFTPKVIVIAFAIFFITAYALVPLFFSFATKISLSVRIHSYIPREVLFNSSHALAMALTLVLLLTYLRSNGKTAFNALLGKGEHMGVDLGIGAVAWILSFPVVLLVGQVVNTIVYALFHNIGEAQNAIKYVQMMRNYPVALVFTIFSVSLMAPITEELLFRGLLQTWLGARYGRAKSILFSSLIFAAVHFSLSHGNGNFSLLASLFTLSLYLGFIYERQRSLIAPFALHALFNTISVTRVIMEG